MLRVIDRLGDVLDRWQTAERAAPVATIRALVDASQKSRLFFRRQRGLLPRSEEQSRNFE
jgi:hypothetical protein